MTSKSALAVSGASNLLGAVALVFYGGGGAAPVAAACLCGALWAASALLR